TERDVAVLRAAADCAEDDMRRQCPPERAGASSVVVLSDFCLPTRRSLYPVASTPIAIRRTLRWCTVTWDGSARSWRGADRARGADAPRALAERPLRRFTLA